MLDSDAYWGIGTRTNRYLKQNGESIQAKGAKGFIADQLGSEQESLEVLLFAASELITRSRNRVKNAPAILLLREIDSQLEGRYSERMTANGKAFARGFLGVEMEATEEALAISKPSGNSEEARSSAGRAQKSLIIMIAATAGALIGIAHLSQKFMNQREAKNDQRRAAPVAGFKLLSESNCEGIEASLYAAMENSVKTEDPIFPWGYPASVVIGEEEHKGTLKTSVLLEMFEANDGGVGLTSNSSLIGEGRSVRTRTTLRIGNKEYSCSRKDISDLRRQ